MRSSRVLAVLASGAVAAGLVSAPANAAPSQVQDVFAEGLAGPLTIAVHDGGTQITATQSFAGLLTRHDQRGGTTVLVAGNGPDTEIVGVSLGARGTYYVETDYAAGTSHINRIDTRGASATVSDDLMAYEAYNNPDGGSTYGFSGLSNSCASKLATFEQSFPPGALPPLSSYHGIVESHGYQTSVGSRGDVFVADAAANAILSVDGRSGQIRTVAVIPATPATFTAQVAAGLEGQLEVDIPDCLTGATFIPEPVPTDVEIGSDGMLYVSTLQGWLGEMQPLSAVYRVNPDNGRTTKLAGGMHGATGLALHGKKIVVAEMFAGELSVIDEGSTTARTVLAVPSGPADVEVSGTAVFVSTMAGEILRTSLR